MRLERYLGWGCLAILALMPFHAFAVVSLGHIFGHEAYFQIWKETLVVAMAALAVWFFAEKPKRLVRQYGLLVKLILLFALVAVAVTLLFGNLSFGSLLGLRTDLMFLAIFLIAGLVHDKTYKRLGQKILLGATAVIALFEIALSTILPTNFLTRFGYGPKTVAPYLPYGSLKRFPSTLGGANQLGAFLILPIALTFKLAWRQRKPWQFGLLLIEVAALYFTGSRSGWLGALVALIIVTFIEIPSQMRTWLAGGLVLAAILAALAVVRSDNSLIRRSQGASGNPDAKHLRAVISGAQELIHHPLGEGAGSAGPASFRSDRPQISENYYLQIGIETGFVGLTLFIAICGVLAWQLWQWRTLPGLAGPLLGALAGISVVNLFLHGWADSTTALTYWTLAGLTFGGAKEKRV